MYNKYFWSPFQDCCLRNARRRS